MKPLVKYAGITALVVAIIASSAFRKSSSNVYRDHYFAQLQQLSDMQAELLTAAGNNTLQTEEERETLRKQILQVRHKLKASDFWFRYLDPTVYKQMNGPLPVEWETEVFEKFEKPYKREGAGLSLALQYLDEEHPEKETLLQLIRASVNAEHTYRADSITNHLNTYHHFYLCNRLYLLNLAAIYTTGFDCPDTASVIPELRSMMRSVNSIYETFNESYPATKLSDAYKGLYSDAVEFVSRQSAYYSSFDHFTFIRNYVNPLFAMNQQMIMQYKVVSRSLTDYALNKEAGSIFKKNLYNGQNPKGIFLRVNEPAALAEIEELGRLLFYDPILSGNNERSCASCHKADQYFTDTVTKTALRYDKKGMLPRNTPSLVNAEYNHLIMLDGLHYTLQHQVKAVVGNATEMGSSETEALGKIMSCKTYAKGFTKLLAYTPQEKEVTFEHIASAISWYYSRFSNTYAPFDEAMTDLKPLDPEAVKGFNLFMSKAQCATCHFVPQFNGVKPPYIGSEFEVIGVPADTAFTRISDDRGRYEVNPAVETLNAFRTGTVRNAAHTMPYMHNGVFATLEEVMDFYNNGGGAGRGLNVSNQTLSEEKLGLSETEKQQIIRFMASLSEPVPFAAPPEKLPASKDKSLNKRIAGGTY